jgi:hypothetical protein
MVESTADNMQSNEGNSPHIVDDGTTNNNNHGTSSQSASNKSEDRHQHEPNNNADAPSKEEDNGGYFNSNDGKDFSGSEEQSKKDNERGGSSEGNGASVGTSTYSSSSKQSEKDMSNNGGVDSDNMTDRKDSNDTMEVEEESASDNSGNKRTMEEEGTADAAANTTTMQRRSSKRQRSSSTSSNNADVGLTKKSKQDDDNKKKEDDGYQQQWTTTTPTYRWIDDPDAKGDHQGLEIDFGGGGASNDPNNNSKGTNNFTVRPGDIILISSGDVPWDNSEDSTDTAQSLPPQQKEKGEAEVAIYNDPASREPGIGALDPFIGYVERLYEEEDSTATTGSKNNKDATISCLQKMKVRTRWFFKKEEIKGLSGRFVLQGYQHGDAKDAIYGAMSSNDLILTDQSDDNIVTSILRKITVVKRKPLDGSNNDEDMSMMTPEGAFVCRYELKLFPASSSSSSSGGKGRVELYPFEDVSDNFVIPTDDGDEYNNIGSTDEELSSSGKEERGDGASNTDYAQVPYPMSPRRLITEGPTVGKIHVGPNHQAVIPEQIDLERKASRRGMANPPLARIPTLVWDPKSNEDSVVNSFLDEACSMLIQKRITTAGMKPFHEVNCVESPDPRAETKRPRECRIDCLLTELHQCKYDVKKALKRVSENPDKFMTIWTRDEKEQFDASYRAYRESLRAISQSMGEERSTNDVIDYLYRFKLVENFRRFTAKKREKAREMMESVENRMLNEKAKEDAKNEYVEESDASSSEDDKGKRVATPNGVLSSVSTAGPVNNRIRTWFRTGGGDEDAVGATQLRRNEAANLLSKIKETVGEEAYLVLAKSLKAYYAHSDSSLTEVKNTAADIMKAHPDLLKTFEHFLPREVRS